MPQGAKTIVVVRFSLKIEKALESEFMNVMSVSLAKELLAGLGLEEEDDSSAAAEPPRQTWLPAAARSSMVSNRVPSRSKSTV